MRRRSWQAIVAGLFLSGAATTAQAAPLVLHGAVTIVERPDEAGPVRKAAADLASDLQDVLGVPARVVTASTAPAGSIEIAPRTGGTPETFAIAVRDGHLVLSGADTRGAIYAIYEFSQDYLGVDPMAFWTDRKPVRRAAVTLPDGLSRSFPAPVFTYRGFFINDEDQLTGWAPGEAKDHTGISLAVWDKIFETILRLKGNMVVPGTWIFPDDPQVKAAGERGLILNQHHAIPVGFNVARWPANVPYSLSAHPEILERAWTDAVHLYDPHQEILWSVGLRGLSDTSYASMDPSVVGNDKRQGELISKAIADQMRIVRSVDPHARFVTDLWQEGARLKAEGYLTIPPEVTTVWADTGYGLMQDKGQVAAGQGMYTHVAMLNGRANQLSEMVPIARIDSEFGRYIKAGATAYMLVNTSDVRAIAMTARHVMDVAWGGVQKDEPAPTAYRRWAADQFGPRAADAVGRFYEAYFGAFSHLPSGDEYGDQLYQDEARQLILETMESPPWYSIPGQAPLWSAPHILGIGAEPSFYMQMGPEQADRTVARELATCAAAATRWDGVWRQAQAARSLVAPERRAYYDYAVLTMTAINRDSNHMLLMLARAIRDVKAGNRAAARAEAQATMADFDEIGRLEAETAIGKWQHWWRGEWLDGIPETRSAVESFIRWIDDPMTTLPPPVLSNGWQGYYHIMHYEGSRAADVR